MSSPAGTETDVRPNPRNVVMATRVNADEANYIQGAMAERGITSISEFLRVAAVEWASR